jgi:hypothetical protein
MAARGRSARSYPNVIALHGDRDRDRDRDRDPGHPRLDRTGPRVKQARRPGVRAGVPAGQLRSIEGRARLSSGRDPPSKRRRLPIAGKSSSTGGKSRSIFDEVRLTEVKARPTNGKALLIERRTVT